MSLTRRRFVEVVSLSLLAGAAIPNAIAQDDARAEDDRFSAENLLALNEASQKTFERFIGERFTIRNAKRALGSLTLISVEAAPQPLLPRSIWLVVCRRRSRCPPPGLRCVFGARAENCRRELIHSGTPALAVSLCSLCRPAPALLRIPTPRSSPRWTSRPAPRVWVDGGIIPQRLLPTMRPSRGPSGPETGQAPPYSDGAAYTFPAAAMEMRAR